MDSKPNKILSDSFLTSAKTSPDKKVAIVEGREYSYGELENNAKRMAQALVDRGLHKGDRVAVYMDNSWPCIISIYAITLAGGVFLVINPQTKSEKLRYIIKDSGAAIIISETNLESQTVSALSNLDNLSHLICYGDDRVITRLMTELSHIIVEGFKHVMESTVFFEDSANIEASNLAALIYTSGSTGDPKGVMHSHSSMTFAIDSLVEYLRLSREQVILSVLPFSFDYGLYQLLMAVHLGATIVLERSFTYPAAIFKRIEEYSITAFPGVPTIFSLLLSAHRRNPLCFPSITRVTNTAAALPEEYLSDLKEIFPNALIYKMYGLTECKRACYLEPELIELKVNSVGKAIPGTEVFILKEDGTPARAGEVGVLHVRGPHIMMGYWNQPELTDYMLKPGKYPNERILCTHDLFHMDDDGFMYFLGRSDDIIKSRGEKVSPIEVENVLHGIDGISEAAVIGVSNETLGQSIHAYVSLEFDSILSDKKIKKICMSKLENFMVPQEVFIVDKLPKTTTGKISKKSLAIDTYKK